MLISLQEVYNLYGGSAKLDRYTSTLCTTVCVDVCTRTEEWGP